MIRLTTTSLDQTVELGRRLGSLATRGDVLGLDGELGAGKTLLVRGLAEGMGLYPAHVSSPTFVLMHEYENDSNPAAPVLVHIDAYRLSGPDDLHVLGYDEDLRRSTVTAVEWAQRLLPDSDATQSSSTDATDQWGPNRLHILLEHRPRDARRITLKPAGTWVNRLQDFARLDTDAV